MAEAIPTFLYIEADMSAIVTATGEKGQAISLFLIHQSRDFFFIGAATARERIPAC